MAKKKAKQVKKAAKKVVKRKSKLAATEVQVDREWKVKHGLNVLKEAEEIKNDKKFMNEIMKEKEKQIKELNKL